MRVVQYRLWVDWDFDGDYTEETANMISASGSLRVVGPDEYLTGGRGQVGSCSITMHNPDGRYSHHNWAGPLFDDLLDGGSYYAPMYLEVSVDGVPTHHRVFTGVIKSVIESHGGGETVRFECRDNCELLMQAKVSSPLYEDYTEAALIEAYINHAGVATTYNDDPAMFTIPFGWLDDESVWEDIQAVAGACGGRFYADRAGSFVYENAAAWVTGTAHTQNQVTLYADQGLIVRADAQLCDRIDVTYDGDDVYKTTTVEFAQRVMRGRQRIWKDEEVKTVPAGGSITVVAKFTAAVSTDIDAFPAPVAQTNFRACTAGGVDITSDVHIAFTRYAQRAELEISNGNATHDAYMVKLNLWGKPLEGRPQQEIKYTSSNAFWNNRPARVRSIRNGNPYLETEQQANMLTAMVTDQSQLPRTYATAYGVPGTPTRAPGDRVALQAGTTSDDGAAVYHLNLAAFVVGITWQLGEGYTQDLQCIAVAGVYQSDNYFVIGQDLLGASGPNTAQLFY
jgi:hypothetical protein